MGDDAACDVDLVGGVTARAGRDPEMGDLLEPVRNASGNTGAGPCIRKTGTSAAGEIAAAGAPPS